MGVYPLVGGCLIAGALCSLIKRLIKITVKKTFIHYITRANDKSYPVITTLEGENECGEVSVLRCGKKYFGCLFRSRPHPDTPKMTRVSSTSPSRKPRFSVEPIKK